MATHWKIISLGNNGTYLNGQAITEVPVVDGMIISLAISGPQLQINLGSTAQKSTLKTVPKQHSLTQKNNKDLDTFIRELLP
jgi:pSer/pThr/pTyr-binding forkhead associated (FHA) protein